MVSSVDCMAFGITVADLSLLENYPPGKLMLEVRGPNRTGLNDYMTQGAYGSPPENEVLLHQFYLHIESQLWIHIIVLYERKDFLWFGEISSDYFVRFPELQRITLKVSNWRRKKIGESKS